MIFYLYLKNHNSTNLKYLGYTTQNPYKYKGSGKRWLNHIKKHNNDVSTQILKECKTKKEIKYWGEYYSKLWNIIESNEFANLMNESGDGGNISLESRKKISLALKGKSFSSEHKLAISQANRGRLKGIPKSLEHRRKISESHIGILHTEETKKKIADHFSKKYILTFPDKHQETIINLNAYCKLNNLDQGNLVKGSYKGIKCQKYLQELEDIQFWLNNLGFNFKINNSSLLEENKNIRIEYCKFSEYLKENKNLLKLYKQHQGKLFIIYENIWKEKNQQIKNFIQGSLGIYTKKLMARKCSIEILTNNNEEVNKFLENYHIQGKPKSYKLSILLLYNNEIIGIMTFGKHHRQNNNQLILNRLCWKTGYTVTGGSKRMFSKINKNVPIISWSDNRYTEGEVYKRLGFVLDKELPISYDYFNKDNQYKSKQSMAKNKIGALSNQTEKEKTKELGWNRIWDCGKKRWIYNNINI